jgi:hypothetical protein
MDQAASSVNVACFKVSVNPHCETPSRACLSSLDSNMITQVTLKMGAHYAGGAGRGLVWGVGLAPVIEAATNSGALLWHPACPSIRPLPPGTAGRACTATAEKRMHLGVTVKGVPPNKAIAYNRRGVMNLQVAGEVPPEGLTVCINTTGAWVGVATCR